MQNENKTIDKELIPLSGIEKKYQLSELEQDWLDNMRQPFLDQPIPLSGISWLLKYDWDTWCWGFLWGITAAFVYVFLIFILL